MSKADLKQSATCIREAYLQKPVGSSNVAVADVHLAGDVVFCAGATSKGGRKSPIPRPKCKSEGGYFEPSIDSRTGRLMDTDAEYKVLSAIAETIEMAYYREVEGVLCLYSELQPCESCKDVLRQFNKKFPNIRTEVFWDYPYP